MTPNDNQFTMEMARTEGGDVPKSYSLNMFKDFVPMCVFSETPQGEDPVCIYWMIFHIIFFCGRNFVILLIGES